MNKLINNLIKVVMISGIVMMFNVGNIMPSFACEDNLYIINNQYVDSNNVFIIKYSNGSWSSCDFLNNKFILTEKDSAIEFNNIKDLCENINKKNNIEMSPILKNNSITEGISLHSDKIYCDNLSSNEKLQEYATKWLKDNYNMTLDIPIIYDDLGNKYNGHYLYENKTPKLIQINKGLKGIDICAEKTLIHELVHYVLSKNNKDFTDETDTFRKECVKMGGNTNYGENGYLNSHLKCTM